ncbi:hypothetical protein N2152v2_001384 [Parachlorella kessleri]
MKRRKEFMSLAYRVFQGCSQGSLKAPWGCQLSSLAGGQAFLASLALQQAKQLTPSAPSAAAKFSLSTAAATVWALQARRLVTAASYGSAVKAAAADVTRRQSVHLERLLCQQRGGQVLQRSFASEAAAKASQPAPRSRKLQGKRSLWSGLLLLAPGVLAAFLGKWQLDRRNWKLDLLGRRQLMVTGEPVDLFLAEDCPPEYTRVRAGGVFDHGKTLLVGPRPRVTMGKAEKGFLAVTPLCNPELGRTVLVNRGWVPASWSESPEEREKGQPKEQVVVDGVLRLGEQPGEFVPANQPAKGEWYYLNAAEMAQACDLPTDTPFVEAVAGDEPAYREPTAADLLAGRQSLMPRPTDEFPQAKSVEDFMHWSVMPRDHLNYALTWFTLSGFTLLMAVKAIRQGVRK